MYGTKERTDGNGALLPGVPPHAESQSGIIRSLDTRDDSRASAQGMTPTDYATRKEELANEYAQATERMREIAKIKAVRWLTLRAGVKSDTAADRAWDATVEGLEENDLKLRMKALDKLISAMSTMFNALNGESRSQW